MRSSDAASRATFLVWALVACPVIAWFVAVVWLEGDVPDSLALLLLFGLPALLTIIGGLVARRSATETALSAFFSALLSGMTLVLTILYLSSQGVFD